MTVYFYSCFARFIKLFIFRQTSAKLPRNFRHAGFLPNGQKKRELFSNVFFCNAFFPSFLVCLLLVLEKKHKHQWFSSDFILSRVPIRRPTHFRCRGTMRKQNPLTNFRTRGWLVFVRCWTLCEPARTKCHSKHKFALVWSGPGSGLCVSPLAQSATLNVNLPRFGMPLEVDFV